MIQYSSLWEQTSVSWACADGVRFEVVDEEFVSNINRGSCAPDNAFQRINQGCRNSLQNQAIPISAILALKYPDPILKPSSLLGFFSKTEIRETEKDF